LIVKKSYKDRKCVCFAAAVAYSQNHERRENLLQNGI